MKRLNRTGLAIAMLAATPVLAGGSFLESDVYRSGDESVGVFLDDGDYGKMLADVVHLGKLDWAWVLGQQGSPKVPSLGFSVEDYKSVTVPPPRNHSGDGFDWIPERAHEVLKIHCKRLGWTPAEQGDLLLESAIVGVADIDGFGPTQFFNATSRHHVLFEFRLTEAGSGKTLLVAREKARSANLVGAIWRAASRLTHFLAEPKAPSYPGDGQSVSLDVFEMPGKKQPHKFEKQADPRAILRGALTSSGLFGPLVDGSSESDYGLEVRVREANLVGAYQTTVNLLAVYTLKDRNSGETVSAEEIGTSTTISALEIRSGGKRMKATVAAAFLDNFDSFLFRHTAKQ